MPTNMENILRNLAKIDKFSDLQGAIVVVIVW